MTHAERKAALQHAYATCEQEIAALQEALQQRIFTRARLDAQIQLLTEMEQDEAAAAETDSSPGDPGQGDTE